MRDALRDAIEKGMPSLAECGGFMYLHDAIEADGTRYPMAGVIHGTCRDAGKLVRFGYASFHVPGDPGNEEFTIQGHEFHYYDSDACGDDCLAVKPVTGKSWRFGYYGEDRLWGFGHMYYPSEPRLAEWFVMKCRNWRR